MKKLLVLAVIGYALAAGAMIAMPLYSQPAFADGGSGCGNGNC